MPEAPETALPAVEETPAPTTAPAAPKPSRKDRRSKTLLATTDSGTLEFFVNPKQDQTVTITAGPKFKVGFKVKPEYYDVLSAIKWTDPSQGVRHAVISATKPSPGHRSTLTKLISKKEDESSVSTHSTGKPV